MTKEGKNKRRSYVPKAYCHTSKARINSLLFYQSKEWRTVRKYYYYSNPLCEVCLSKGKTVVGEDVHHIIEWMDGGDKFDEANLMTCCKSCHSDLGSYYRRLKMIWCKVRNRIVAITDRIVNEPEDTEEYSM